MLKIKAVLPRKKRSRIKITKKFIYEIFWLKIKKGSKRDLPSEGQRFDQEDQQVIWRTNFNFRKRNLEASRRLKKKKIKIQTQSEFIKKFFLEAVELMFLKKKKKKNHKKLTKSPNREGKSGEDEILESKKKKLSKTLNSMGK